MDLEDVKAFVAFAEHLNFTHAAKALHISQPALHAKIQRFSEALGVPLYSKEGRTLHLTVEGRELLRFGRDMDAQVTSFLQELRSGTARPNVSIASGEGTYRYLLAPLLADFATQHDAQLSLLTKDRDATLAAIFSGEAQLGVVAAPEKLKQVTCEPLWRVAQVLICPKTHPLARKKQVKLKDLEGEALVVPPIQRPHRVLIGRMLMAAGVSWRVGIEVNGWELILQFASLGMGLAIVNDCCEIPRGMVAKSLPELPTIQYYLLHRRGHLAPPVEALKQFLLTQIPLHASSL